MSITGLMRRLSLIGTDAIWQLSLGCLLMRNIASFLRYTGYLNFINGPISRVLLLILVHVQLLSCLFFQKSEKELCSQTTHYTATSVDSNRYALSIHHKSSKVPCETVVLGPNN